MAMQGKCNNFGNCTKADNHEIISVITGQHFNCPECGLPLLAIKKPMINKWLIISIVLLFIVVSTVIANHILNNNEVSPLNNSTSIPISPTSTNPSTDLSISQKAIEPIKNPLPDTTCTLAPIETVIKPNWYAVIEIGSKGIKPIAVQFERTKDGKLRPTAFNDTFDTQDVTPSEEVSIPRVIEAVCADVNQFHSLYGDLPIYLVGSSSMAIVEHRATLEKAINDAIHRSIDSFEFVTADKEMGYLSSGIWTPPLPTYRRCESTVLDIGSGNILVGYLENCNPKVGKTPEEHGVSFEIKNLGTVKFSKNAQKKVDDNMFPTFLIAASDTRKELEAKLDEQVRTRPELTNGKKRMYMSGGAVWIMNTLLCLDCPQYDKREYNSNKQEKYTVIKITDIEEFYRYVSQDGERICDYTQENPYLRRDMDGGYNKPWNESRIEKQKVAIQKVCGKFKATQDLISAAEILRAIKNKMELDKNSHIFFMQNNLYTWARQYLIEKIGQQSD